MLYLLDANTLMEAHGTFYPVDRIPQFWDWLQGQGEAGRVKMPAEIYNEFSGRDGLHVEWINRKDVKKSLLLDEQADPVMVQTILKNGYQGDDSRFNDIELTKCGQDPFLAAYASADRDNRVVVTRERSKTTQRLGNTKLPDACRDCQIKCIDDFELYRTLDFNLSNT